MTDAAQPIEAAPRAAYEAHINACRRHQAQRGAGTVLGRYPKWEDLHPDLKIIWMATHAAPPLPLIGSGVEQMVLPLLSGLFQRCCEMSHRIAVLEAQLPKRAPELAQPLRLSDDELRAIMAAPDAPDETGIEPKP